MRFYILQITTIFLLLFGVMAQAQGVAVSANVDSTNMVIGDKFQLHLVTNIPQNAVLESIDLTELRAVENLDIEAETNWDTTQLGQEVLLKKRFNATSLGFWFLLDTRNSIHFKRKRSISHL